MSAKRRRRCILCGSPLTIEHGEVCIGCSLIAVFGGSNPRVREAQREAWNRVLAVAEERRRERETKAA